jgi:hypothetical protein
VASRRLLRYAEFALWVVAATTLIVAGAAVPAFLLGEGLPTLKLLLFVIGTLLFGVGSFGIQPERPKRDGQIVDLEGEEPNRFEVKIQELPPLRGERLPFSDRVDRNVKLFTTAVAVLAVSAALELVFGVPG